MAVLWLRSEQHSHSISKKTLHIILGLTLGLGLLLSILAFGVYLTRRRESKRKSSTSESQIQLPANSPDSFYMVEASTGIIVERPRSSYSPIPISPALYNSTLRRSEGYLYSGREIDRPVSASSSEESDKSEFKEAFWNLTPSVPSVPYPK